MKEAYFRLAKRFHPDAHHGESSATCATSSRPCSSASARRTRSCATPAGAATTSSGSDGRARPGSPSGPGAGRGSRALPPPRDLEAEARAAEEALRRAAKLYEAEKYWDAIQLLEPAIEPLPPKLKTRARVLLARCNLKNPKWVRRAEETLLAATREDPKAVDAWALLGQVYADKGLASRAQSMFRKVLELKPDHEEALQFLPGGGSRAAGGAGATAGPAAQALPQALSRNKARSEKRYAEGMRCIAVVLLLGLAAPASADVVVLLNGDRITGKIEGRPRAASACRPRTGCCSSRASGSRRSLYDDGTEEAVNAPAAPPKPPAPPPPRPIPLALSIRGDTFWQAWDPKSAPADPTLRLEVRLDHVTIATYTDANLDPEDLPKAVVNSFVFSPERLLDARGRARQARAARGHPRARSASA